MSAIAKSAGVVFAAIVGVPEIDERLRNRPARAGENLSAEFDQPRLAVRLDEIGAFGRTGFEKRPFALPHGRCVAVMALRRRCKRLRERIIDHKPRRGKRARGEQSAACGLKLHQDLLACGPAPVLQSYPRWDAGGHHDRVNAPLTSQAITPRLSQPHPGQPRLATVAGLFLLGMGLPMGQTDFLA